MPANHDDAMACKDTKLSTLVVVNGRDLGDDEKGILWYAAIPTRRCTGTRCSPRNFRAGA